MLPQRSWPQGSCCRGWFTSLLCHQQIFSTISVAGEVNSDHHRVCDTHTHTRWETVCVVSVGLFPWRGWSSLFEHTAVLILQQLLLARCSAVSHRVHAACCTFSTFQLVLTPSHVRKFPAPRTWADGYLWTSELWFLSLSERSHLVELWRLLTVQNPQNDKPHIITMTP